MKKPNFKEEKKLWEKGYRYVIGVDEVGRGAFAGPVAVGAVVFKKYSKIIAGVNDSKLLNPRKREVMSKIIKEKALISITSLSSISLINQKGIGKATQMAFRKAIMQIQKELENERLFVLADGYYIPYLKGIGVRGQKGIIKGDRKSVSIAAASIIAKVYRDNLMRKIHHKYPDYNFAKHKGYGTKEHQKAIKKHGLSKIHRKSFRLEKFT